MSEGDLLKNIWRAKNFWLAIYWYVGENPGWKFGWWASELYRTQLWRLLFAYRTPRARLPRGAPIMSTPGCVGLIIGGSAAVASGLFLLYLIGVSWQIIAGLVVAAVIFGLCLVITIAILDWRVE